jgi:type II secretory ATPase GspE/PulE/Tfp pilus assembly ATPase PilB-like protein
MLTASDRFMRDIIAIEDVDQQEPEIINVRSVTFDPQKNETPLTHLEKLLLKQPDALMFPQLPDGRALDRYCDLANVDKKMVFTRIHAKHSVDALFRLMVLKPTIEKLTEALSCVLYHRLIRLLCNNCKQPYPPNPALLQRLGILPGRLSNLYTHFQLRPEQAVDEKGQPIEVPPCHVCGGLGYFGRTGIFELLVINDEMREAMVEKPKMDQLMQIAKRSGQISLRDEGVVLVAKGATSVEELQRILKK